MEYYSTRDTVKRMSASEAISRGLAPDGGLYVPATLPQVSERELTRAAATRLRRASRSASLPCTCLNTRRRSWTGSLRTPTAPTSTPPPWRPCALQKRRTAYLELWHGPTAAFKDMALQMLPHLLTASLKKCGEERGVCILVATSGDTGKAALEGFADVRGDEDTRFLSARRRLGRAEAADGHADGRKRRSLRRGGQLRRRSDRRKKIFGDRELAEKLSAAWLVPVVSQLHKLGQTPAADRILFLRLLRFCKLRPHKMRRAHSVLRSYGELRQHPRRLDGKGDGTAGLALCVRFKCEQRVDGFHRDRSLRQTSAFPRDELALYGHSRIQQFGAAAVLPV